MIKKIIFFNALMILTFSLNAYGMEDKDNKEKNNNTKNSSQSKDDNPNPKKNIDVNQNSGDQKGKVNVVVNKDCIIN